MKYADSIFKIIATLDGHRCYTASIIVRLAEAQGFFDSLEGPVRKQAIMDCRNMLFKATVRANFDPAGDGLARINDHQRIRGWRGWRWKQLSKH